MIVAVVYYIASRLNLFFLFCFFFLICLLSRRKIAVEDRGNGPYDKILTKKNKGIQIVYFLLVRTSLNSQNSRLLCYDHNNHCQNLLWWLTLHYSWGNFRSLCYIYSFRYRVGHEAIDCQVTWKKHKSMGLSKWKNCNGSREAFTKN